MDKERRESPDRRRPASGGYRRPGRRRFRSGGLSHKLALLAFIGLACVTAFLLIDYVRQSAATNRLQDRLRAEASQNATDGFATSLPSPGLTVPVSPPSVTAPPLTAQSMERTIQPTPYPLPTQGASVLTNLLSLLRKNQDLVGWLKSEAVSYIDFPLVKRDNDYYVRRDFYGRDSMAGTVFMDEINSIMPRDQNLILHGHNMKDGTMFGKLARLIDRSTLLEKPFFHFSTLYEAHDYVPYAVALISVDPLSGEYFDVLRVNFGSQEELNRYVDNLQARSKVKLPVEVKVSDRLLTLVTCHGLNKDERLIISLRALRPGESKETVRNLLSNGLR